MAKKVAGGLTAVVLTSAGAEKLVFDGDKRDQIDAILGQASAEKSDGENAPIKQKEFYWDQIVLVLVSSMLGLSFLEISIEFFRGSEVQCFFEIDNWTISKGNYINSYCYGSLPNTQYYLVFILISALIVFAPQFLWSAYFAAQFDFFFDLIKKLDRLRDTNTGEYSPQNFERVKKLEERFNKSQIFLFYKLKLVLQLVICVVILVLNAAYFRKEDFNEEFDCPKNCVLDGNGNQSVPNCSDLWPLDEQLKCVYNSFRLLNFLHSTVYGLVCIMIIVLVIGLIWSGLTRHATELGAEAVADFCYHSCLNSEAYSFTSWMTILENIFHSCEKMLKCSCIRNCNCMTVFSRISKCCCVPWKRLKCSCKSSWTKAIFKCCHSTSCLSRFSGWLDTFQCFNPRIKNDLDFLLMRLFKADSGHGQVFKDIQIAKHLRALVSDDQKRLYLLNKIQNQRLLSQILLKITKLRTEAKSDREKQATVDDEIIKLKRINDIRNHFYSSGFQSWPGESPDLKIYELFQSLVGALYSAQPSIRDVIFGFFNLAPRNKLAMDISFGTSTSYSLVLARAFYDVATVHFNRFYKNPKQICRVDKFQANFRTITFHDDIFSQTAKAATDSEHEINELFSRKHDGESLDFLLIGPMTSVSMSDTTNILIEKMYFKNYFTKGLLLLAVRPLKIGDYVRVADYWQFKPSEDLFDEITDKDEVRGKITAAGVEILTVESPTSDEDMKQPSGLRVNCNGVKCIFEFRMFRYKGDRIAPSDDGRRRCESMPVEPTNQVSSRRQRSDAKK